MAHAALHPTRKLSKTDFPEDRAEPLAEILRAIAHPLRLRIIAVLCSEDLHVNALADRLGAKQAIVSQQLRSLRMLRLVEGKRQDGLVRYRLLEPRLRDLVRCLSECSAGERQR